MNKDLQRRNVIVRFLALGPARVYAGLDAYRIGRGWKWGWTAHAFKEIFGVWPRREDRLSEPAILDGYIVEEWVAGRKKKPTRIKAVKPAPLLERAVPPPKLDASGFVQGTLMSLADFEVDL
jgi:hypothetical protein